MADLAESGLRGGWGEYGGGHRHYLSVDQWETPRRLG